MTKEEFINIAVQGIPNGMKETIRSYILDEVEDDDFEYEERLHDAIFRVAKLFYHALDFAERRLSKDPNSLGNAMEILIYGRVIDNLEDLVRKLLY